VGADSRGRGGTYHGFIYQNGVFNSLDVPGASLTDARGINDAGQVVGVVYDSNGNEHGFAYSQGVFQVIDSPDLTAAFTETLGIKNNGVIVGGYADANFVGYSFQWSGGKFTVFNPTFSVESAAHGISQIPWGPAVLIPHSKAGSAAAISPVIAGRKKALRKEGAHLRKLQRSLDCLKAWFVAKRVKKRVFLEPHQPGTA